MNAAAEWPHGGAWWVTMRDPVLTELVETALTKNLQLDQGRARVEAAAALVRVARAGRAISLSLAVTGTRSKTSFIGTGAFSGFSGGSSVNSDYRADVAAAYEVDLWHRLESGELAAARTVAVAEADLRVMAVMIAARVAENWYDIVAGRERIELLRRQIETAEKLTARLQQRFGMGQVSAEDVLAQRERLAQNRARLPLLELNLELSENGLALLLGRGAHEELTPETSTLPPLPSLPAALTRIAPEAGNLGAEDRSKSTPALPGMELLMNRPDVEAALERVAAADLRVAEAVAARMPSLNLSGGTGLNNRDAGMLLDRWLWNVAASVVAPIVDGGRRKAEVARTEAVLKEQLSAFSEVYLTAVKELDDGFARERFLEEHILEIVREQKAARGMLNQTRFRYRKGIGNYPDILRSKQHVLDTDRRLLDARRLRLSGRISLYRALSGTRVRAAGGG